MRMREASRYLATERRRRGRRNLRVRSCAMMKSPGERIVDETCCFLALCQHPSCWEAMRRIERGAPRYKTPKAAHQELKEAKGDPLPTLKILNIGNDELGCSTRAMTSWTAESPPAQPKDHTTSDRSESVWFPGFNTPHILSHRKWNLGQTNVKAQPSVNVQRYPPSEDVSPSSSVLIWVPGPHASSVHTSQPGKVCTKELIFALPPLPADVPRRMRMPTAERRTIGTFKLNEPMADANLLIQSIRISVKKPADDGEPSSEDNGAQLKDQKLAHFKDMRVWSPQEDGHCQAPSPALSLPSNRALQRRHPKQNEFWSSWLHADRPLLQSRGVVFQDAGARRAEAGRSRKPVGSPYRLDSQASGPAGSIYPEWQSASGTPQLWVKYLMTVTQKKTRCAPQSSGLTGRTGKGSISEKTGRYLGWVVSRHTGPLPTGTLSHTGEKVTRRVVPVASGIGPWSTMSPADHGLQHLRGWTACFPSLREPPWAPPEGTQSSPGAAVSRAEELRQPVTGQRSPGGGADERKPEPIPVEEQPRVTEMSVGGTTPAVATPWTESMSVPLPPPPSPQSEQLPSRL
ncbi:uncharacterized protein LOC114657074 isoform X2 [Erpetoichthys calabaricus]|uniref:uncharacterized protein LOC114657074 isoform X2 n=1 Tax=Erpetoichthys calabaricus TaxID=27687 RepID=UPI002234218B|nr:uncharacterized protein LOC114657074 isoform X2 [Erpetoichthys calabaricus]